MSSFLKENNLGRSTYDLFKQLREQNTSKWGELGFLDGLEGNKKDNMALLFENQAKVLLESTSSGSSGSFETVAFPMIRRIFSRLLINEVASIQALNLPIGKIFFFKPIISKRDGEGNHTSTMGDQLPDFVCFKKDGTELTKDEMLTTWEQKNLYDLFYNDGIMDHSRGKKKLVVVEAVNVSPKVLNKQGEYEVIDGTNVKLQTASDGTVREVVIAIKGFTEYQGKLAFNGAKGRFRSDGVAMDTESFLSTLTVVAKKEIKDRDGEVIYNEGDVVSSTVMTQKYGKAIVEVNRNHENGQLCNSNGTLHLRLDLTKVVSPTGEETYDGYIGAKVADVSELEFTVSYAEYDTLELATSMGEVSFTLDEVTIDTVSRKLRATWSPELAQDVQAFHNIDAEAELTSVLSEQIGMEIDREALHDLRTVAAWTSRWNVHGWKQTSMASNAYTAKDWNQTLITLINQISAQIQKSTLRGEATFLVVPTEVSAIFNDLEYFHVSDASAESNKYNMGMNKKGMLDGRFTVFVDPYAPADQLLIGRKATSILDTGYVYAPYVPLQLTPVLINHNNFAPVKGISTRYAKKVINNRFYGKIKVDGVRVFNTNELR